MGKGSSSQVVGFRYRMGLHLVLCQGPVDAVQEIQAGERTAWGSDARTPLPLWHGMGTVWINSPNLFGGEQREGGVAGCCDVLPGDAGQVRNDYLVAQLGPQVPAFKGVLSLVARQVYYAANNPYIKPWAVRVRRFVAGWHGLPLRTDLIEVRGRDADGTQITIGMNPAHIIAQCLTDPDWGMGYPHSSIGASLWAAAATLAAEEFGLNLIWTRQQPIEAFITEVLDHIGAVLYLDPELGRFELKLLRDDYTVAELPVLGPDQIVSLERFERAQWGELVNEITVVYTQWQTGGEATLSVANLAAVHLQGGVINQRRDYPGVNHAPLASRLALRDLRVYGTPLARLSLSVAQGSLSRAPLPGDVFRLRWPRLGIEDLVLRVVGVDAGPLGSALWRIDAAEDVFGMQHSVINAVPPVAQEPGTAALPPALVLAVETPYWEIARALSRAELATVTDTDSALSALAAPADAQQSSWSLSTGARTDALTEVGQAEYAPILTLSAALPAAERDVIELPVSSVRLPHRLAAGDYAYLVDASGALREAVAVLAFDAIDSRITLARGVLDTTPQAHAAGTRLIGASRWLADENIERAPGESVFVSAIPRTWTAAGAPVRAANGAPLRLTGRQARPYPPGQIRINGQADPVDPLAGDLVLTWAHRDRTLQTAYLVQQHEGHIGPEPGTTYTVRCYDRDGALVRSISGVTDTSATWSAAQIATDAPGALGNQLTLEVLAVRAGLESWQAQRRTVQRPL
ncbi:phage tail protein [Serpentinimonas maccroryi]|uniref:phage tail protein n=1 Tax=Serpentinimonas maccroryi TaxID=1458426 RepID=UPI0020340EF6|nr:phage tail protein [Serpentinimonas maccroryi]MCM2480212.1 phage tail protein [Serpentinimonas maccroryi]